MTGEERLDARLRGAAACQAASTRSTSIASMRGSRGAVEQHGYGRTPLSRRWPTMFSDVFLVATR
jgi:hypothetical protein